MGILTGQAGDRERDAGNLKFTCAPRGDAATLKT